MSKYVNTGNARNKEQIEAHEKIEKGDFCPFCEKDYIKNEHKKPILINSDHWMATENRWPYKGSSAHILFIHKKHIESIDEISDEAWSELRKITSETTKNLEIPGGTLVLRTGNTNYNGGTVRHIHAQFISGDPNNKEPVLTRVG